MNQISKAFLSLAMVFAAQTATAATYNIDPAHSIVGFSVKHMVIAKVKGNFNKFEGSFDFDEKKNQISNVDVKVDATTINTNEKKRDEHLNSPDFFDTKKFPQITFKADKGSISKGQTMKLPGTLTIRGISKPVTMDVIYNGSIVDPSGKEKLGFSMTGKINRQDFGVSWNKTLDKGGLAVSDEVMIEIEGEAVKK